MWLLFLICPKIGEGLQVETVGGCAAFLDILAPPYNVECAEDGSEEEVVSWLIYRIESSEGDDVTLVMIVSRLQLGQWTKCTNLSEKITEISFLTAFGVY